MKQLTSGRPSCSMSNCCKSLAVRQASVMMGCWRSALAAPFQTFGGQSLYPSVQAKAAQLGFGLVCNHPFVDGNKRNRRSCNAGLLLA